MACALQPQHQDPNRSFSRCPYLPRSSKNPTGSYDLWGLYDCRDFGEGIQGSSCKVVSAKSGAMMEEGRSAQTKSILSLTLSFTTLKPT